MNYVIIIGKDNWNWIMIGKVLFRVTAFPDYIPNYASGWF